jgi:hypothetical protein
MANVEESFVISVVTFIAHLRYIWYVMAFVTHSALRWVLAVYAWRAVIDAVRAN